MCLKKLVCCVVVTCMSQTPCWGQVTEINFVEVDNSAALTGYVTQDLLADFEGQYTGTQLLLKLTSGTIFLHPLGNRLPPSPALVAAIPELEFDTYIGEGSWIPDGPNPGPVPGGGAVDLGGSPAGSPIFDEHCINAAWNPLGGQVGTTAQDDFFLARITLSDDAIGVSHVLVSAAGMRDITRNIPIFGGVIGVPEPSTLLLAAVGLFVSVGRRR